jgi:predicted 2-oxoglutarate/Fe(II)-dependent dioxygenase YbiX
MDRGTVEDAEILSDAILAEADVRNAYSVQPEDEIIASVERRLDQCRAPIAAFFAATLAEREGAGFIRYPAGGYYKPHRDRADDAGWPGAARRAVAVVVFLNRDFEGGLLRIFSGQSTIDDVTPEQGLLVAFPADALHEVTAVRAGTRDVVVDWFYGSAGRSERQLTTTDTA